MGDHSLGEDSNPSLLSFVEYSPRNVDGVVFADPSKDNLFC